MSDEDNNNEFPEGAPERSTGHGHEDVLDNSKPAVAAAPGKILVLAILALAFAFIVIKSLFFGSAPKTPPVTNPVKETVSADTQPVNMNPRDLPAPPAITPPPPPPPPVQEIRPLAPPPPTIVARRTPDNSQLIARNHAPMLATSGTATGTPSSASSPTKKGGAPNDPNSVFAQNVADSATETVVATQVKNLNRTILQGKLIQGVLETAIDSELPGELRAIVSHDTYAENGRTILIPKGSRIIGVYNSAVKRGQARVFIIWTRVIRPDGVDIAINSPGVDALGRAGMGGEVDNHYFETFSTAFLTSALDIGVAGVGQALYGNQNQYNTTGLNGTTVITSPTGMAMQTAIQNIGTVGQSIVGNAVNLQPTIHVDQGEEINIFVNKDIVFPSSLVDDQVGILP